MTLSEARAKALLEHIRRRGRVVLDDKFFAARKLHGLTPQQTCAVIELLQERGCVTCGTDGEQVTVEPS
jgi:hypothetical protein